MSNDDYKVEPVTTAQSLYVLSMAVCTFINAQVGHVTDEEEKTKIAQSFFSIFVWYLASFSKDKPTISKLLRVCADELESQT